MAESAAPLVVNSVDAAERFSASTPLYGFERMPDEFKSGAVRPLHPPLAVDEDHCEGSAVKDRVKLRMALPWRILGLHRLQFGDTPAQFRQFANELLFRLFPVFHQPISLTQLLHYYIWPLFGADKKKMPSFAGRLTYSVMAGRPQGSLRPLEV